jgi:hypothetical protein
VSLNPPERKLDPGIAQWTVQALSRVALTFGVLVGSLILMGGEERFGSAALSAALSYPGAPESWGLVALLAGLAGLVASALARPWGVWWSLMALSVWSFFFATSFAEAALNNEQTPLTGIAVYAYVAVTSLVLGVAHRNSRED